MTFVAPYLLYLLAVPLIGLIVTIWRTQHSNRNASLAKAQHLQAGAGGLKQIASARSQRSKVFFYIGLAFIVVAVARPRWGEIEREIFQRSREIIVAIDLSKSMLAEDIKPSRLERAKLVVGSMLDQIKGESVGLVLFAGNAFLQSPMSPDYQILRGFLKDLSPSFVPQGGTDYEAMIDNALDSFKQSDGSADRFLIVISDGESQSEAWRNKISELTEQNVKAICLGFGTIEGSLIPDGNGGYHKDSKGAVVLTKLEPKTLKLLADQTQGLYRDANVWIDLPSLIEETINQGKAGTTSTTAQIFKVERFQYALAPGLVLLLLSLYREFPASPKARKIKTKTHQ